MDNHQTPKLPAPADRMAGRFIDSPHPCLNDDDGLLAQCDLRFQRRSGPGGQHRNKTSSGVFLHHQPTDITAEATERRSQADNRKVALQRLRLRLATECRTIAAIDRDSSTRDKNEMDSREADLRKRYHGKPLKFRDTHPDRSAVLALVLNDLHAAGGQPSLVAAWWSSSTTAIVHLVKSHSPAFALVNAIRAHHARSPLR